MRTASGAIYAMESHKGAVAAVQGTVLIEECKRKNESVMSLVHKRVPNCQFKLTEGDCEEAEIKNHRYYVE